MKHTFPVLIGLSLVLLVGPAAQAGDDPVRGQWIVVAPPQWRTALQPLITHRAGQGYEVTVVERVETADTRDSVGAAKWGRLINERIDRFDGPSYVLLVGAWESGDADADLPAHRGTHGRMRGLSTDHPYGRPDADGAATVAVGRFPAENAEQLRSMVEKTLRYERQDFGDWTNRITLIGGNPGGRSLLENRFAEIMVVVMGGKRLADLHPRWCATCVVDLPQARRADASVPFGRAALAALAEGQLFAFYAGHAGAEGIWSSNAYVARRADFAALNIAGSPGVFVTTGCYSCQTAGPEGQGYAITAFRNPAGPVAVIGAVAESYAIFGQLALDGVLAGMNRDEPPRVLGDGWLVVQSMLAREPVDPVTYWLYDQVDGSRGRVALSDQRREHLEMWTLLGDPALQLPFLPSTLDVRVGGDLKPGGTIHLTVPVGPQWDGARALVTAENRSLPLTLAPPDDQPRGLAAAVPLGSAVAQTSAIIADGRIACELRLPADLPKCRLVIRVVVRNGAAQQMGARVVEIPAQ